MLKENKIRRLFVNHADSSWAELLNAAKEMQVASDSLGNTGRVSAFPLLGKQIRSCLSHTEECSAGLHLKQDSAKLGLVVQIPDSSYLGS